MKQLTETTKGGMDGAKERASQSGGTHEEVDCKQCEGLISWCHVGGAEPLAARAEGEVCVRCTLSRMLEFVCTCN